MVQNRKKKHRKKVIQSFTVPQAKEWAKWVSEQTSERRRGRERSIQSGASKQVSGASEWANGQASGPVLQAVLVILAHCAAQARGFTRQVFVFLSQDSLLMNLVISPNLILFLLLLLWLPYFFDTRWSRLFIVASSKVDSHNALLAILFVFSIFDHSATYGNTQLKEGFPPPPHWENEYWVWNLCVEYWATRPSVHSFAHSFSS